MVKMGTLGLVSIWLAIVGIVKGHTVTIKNFFRRKVTRQYPDVEINLPLGTRGVPVLLRDGSGKLKCTACGVCARACPTRIIEITAHRDENKKRFLDEYKIDMTRCLQCNLCVEACPFDALGMADKFELAAYRSEDLVFDKEDLLQIADRHKVARVGGGEQPRARG